MQPYGAPPPGGGFPGPFPDRRYRVMKVTDWLVVILLVGIPGVNLIMLLIWAFGGGNFNRQNFARAQLLYLAIAFGLVAVVILAIGGLGAAMSRVKSKLPDAPPPATAPADPASPK